ncbi:restriction endonuclease subunit S [Helicobacter pylori]|uniref:restriction endonuclease subunit S n=1 Tax=Helicobacter pylori TaxID=210 RepID=UPI0036F2039D
MDALMLPLNWQRVRLGDICEFGNGGAYETLIVENGDFKLISLNSIDIDGNLKNTMKRVNFYDNSLKQDDIVMVLSDVAHGDFLGLCAVIPSNDYVLNQRMGRLRKRNDCINILFLRLYINANQKYFKMQGQGSSQLNLSKKAIEDFEILLPPLKEQIAIANILSGLDRYLCALDALILKKESVKKALSFELLSQRKRLKGFNQAWQKVRLGDIGKPCMCKRVMKHQTTRYGEIPFYKIGTFGNTADAFISKKLFLEYQTKYSFPKKGDILISASGTIGRAVIYDGKPAYFQDSNIVWIDNDETLVKNDFLFYAYSNVKWNTEHTTILRLYNDNFRNTLIPLPPLNEQIAIADILSALDNEIISLKNKKRQFENIKKALNHDLMSAKIRVLKK